MQGATTLRIVVPDRLLAAFPRKLPARCFGVARQNPFHRDPDITASLYQGWQVQNQSLAGCCGPTSKAVEQLDLLSTIELTTEVVLLKGAGDIVKTQSETNTGKMRMCPKASQVVT